MIEPSLKRLAWRYGCAPSGSLEEKRARQVLIERILRDERPSKVQCPECGTLYVPGERHACARR